MISKKEAEAEETIRRLGISNNVRQTIADIRYSVIEDQGNIQKVPFVFYTSTIVLSKLYLQI